jgi:hypothetical protein
VGKVELLLELQGADPVGLAGPKQIAGNQLTKKVRVSWTMVPAVTEVWRLQART